MAWGVFLVEPPIGDERIEVRRVPLDHPRRVRKDDETWRLKKACPTEEAARNAADSLRARAAGKSGEPAPANTVEASAGK